jgi:glycosyltransferase involved in cell wall biosynthesis
MRLARKGHEITLLTSRYSGSQDRERKDGVEIIRRGSKFSVYLEPPRFLRTQRKRGTGYDVIVDAMNTVPFCSRLYAGNATVVALVYQLTGEIFLKQFPRPTGRLLYTIERSSYVPWFIRGADQVVTLSSSNKDELLEVCPDLDPKKIIVAPPGFDHDDFKPGGKCDEPLLLFMNRLVRYKQPEHLIMGMKEVCAHVPNAKLFIVGMATNTKYTAKLCKLVRFLGLEESISFRLPRSFASNKVSLLQRAWVHVLPSVKEGFGLSILESAACGTPTVGYDVPGVRDAVIHGKTGLLARPGDSFGLAAYLIDLLTNGNKLKLLSEQAIRWAANFLWDDTTEQFASAMKCR